MVAWAGLAELFAGEQRLHGIIKNLTPVMVGDVVVLKVSSSTQRSVIESQIDTIHRHLSETLGCDVQIRIDLQEVVVEAQVYEVDAKYSTIVAHNPFVAQLRELLRADIS